MTAFNMPQNITEATTVLDGVHVLVTASEWKRAAIVYGFTYDAPRGNTSAEQASQMSSSGHLTVAAFARLGINGLKSRESVIKYRKRWMEAMAQGLAKEPTPGKRVTLPTIPFSLVDENDAAQEAVDDLRGTKVDPPHPLGGTWGQPLDLQLGDYLMWLKRVIDRVPELNDDEAKALWEFLTELPEVTVQGINALTARDAPAEATSAPPAAPRSRYDDDDEDDAPDQWSQAQDIITRQLDKGIDLHRHLPPDAIKLVV